VSLGEQHQQYNIRVNSHRDTQLVLIRHSYTDTYATVINLFIAL